ncbi:MAG: hypothetical protein AMXMBFR33_18160 [Candidatus Xenobia bacterium]
MRLNPIDPGISIVSASTRPSVTASQSPVPVDEVALGASTPPAPPQVAPGGLGSAMRAAASLLGLAGPALEAPVREPDPLAEALVGLERFSNKKGYGIDRDEALRLLQQGQEIYLEGSGVKGTDEAWLYLYLIGKSGADRVADPELARGLKALVDGKVYGPDNWDIKPFKAILHYRELAEKPGKTLELFLRHGTDREHVALPLGRFGLSDLRADELGQRIADSLEASAQLGRSVRYYEASDHWQRIHDPARQHAGRSLQERVAVSTALDRKGELYDPLLALARDLPDKKVVDWAGQLAALPLEKALQAIGHLRQVPPEVYLNCLRQHSDPEVALQLTRLRQNPEQEQAYQLLSDKLSLRREVRSRLLQVWAGVDGQVDVFRLQTERPRGEFFANLWSSVPRQDHERFLRYPADQELAFQSLLKADAAVTARGSEHVEGRLQAWLGWYSRLDKSRGGEQATALLQSWPTAEVTPRDARDFAQVLAHHRGDILASQLAWADLARSPSRDLAIALHQLDARQEEQTMTRLGLAEPERAASLRFLAEAGVGLEPSLDALELLSRQQRPLDELAAEYLELRSGLGDRRACSALRQAFEHGPRASESLVRALKVTRDLPAALALLPALERPEPGREERLANLELSGRLGVPEAASLLLESGLDEAGRHALEQAMSAEVSGSALTRLEDYLGRQAQPSESPVVRFARGGELLTRTLGAEQAASELARRLASAYGGEWGEQARALLGTGTEFARHLPGPEELRAATPLLQQLAGRPVKDFVELTAPVGQESLKERCQAAARWLQAGGDVSSWCALTARGELPLEAGLELKAQVSVWDPSQVAPAIELVHRMQRRGELEGDFSQASSAFLGALGRLSTQSFLQGFDLQAVTVEMRQPAPMESSLRDGPMAVTLPGVRLRKRG